MTTATSTSLNRLSLTFADGELIQTDFYCSSSDRRYLVVRGKGEGAYREASGSFQWTRAVRALAVLLLRYKLSCEGCSAESRIEGRKGTLASSLDYAISKQPLWLLDMFGVDGAGRSNARRLLIVSNPNLKFAGPLAISVNERYLKPQSISIRMLEDSQLNSSAATIKLLEAIEMVEKCGESV